MKVTFLGIAGALQYMAVPSDLKVPALELNKKMPDVIVSDGRYGGLAPYKWTITPALPAGLSLVISADTKTATISGTPTEKVGAGAFTITVEDAAGVSAAIQIPSLGILEPLKIENKEGKMNIPAKNGGETYIADYNILDMITGGSGSFSFSATNLSPYTISTSSGKISGTPNESQNQKTATITVKDNATGQTASCTITVGKITGRLSFTKSLGPYNIPAGKINTSIGSINFMNGITGGIAPYSFVIESISTWPEQKLTMSSNGVLTGTRPPSSCEASTLVINISDGNDDSIKVEVTVGEVTGGPITVRSNVTLKIPAGLGEEAFPDVDLMSIIKQGDNTDISYTVDWHDAVWGDTSWVKVDTGNNNKITGFYPPAGCGGGIATVTAKQSGTTIQFPIQVGEVTRSNLRVTIPTSNYAIKPNTQFNLVLGQYIKGYPKTYTITEQTGSRLNFPADWSVTIVNNGTGSPTLRVTPTSTPPATVGSYSRIYLRITNGTTTVYRYVYFMWSAT